MNQIKKLKLKWSNGIVIAVKWKHTNIEIGLKQNQYITLPALKINGAEGHLITKWKLTIPQRLKVLITGTIWMNSMTYNKPFTPMKLSTNRKQLYKYVDDLIPFKIKIYKYLKKKFNLISAVFSFVKLNNSK